MDVVNSNVVEDLPEIVKICREAALLGDYERSLELYVNAVALAESQTRACVKKTSREDRPGRLAVEKWRKAVKVLKKEKDVVISARDALMGHHTLPQQSRKCSPSRQPQTADKSPTTSNDIPVWRQKSSPAPPARKPKVPVQSSRRQQSSKPTSSNRRKGAAGAKKGNGSSSSYVESMEGSPDIELIKSIESTMLTKDLDVRSEDIAGLEGAKTVLEEAVLYPQLMPSYYTGIRRPWKGVLLFGPPGTGKTMLAKAIASECRTSFFNVSSSSLTSKWRGESEKMVSILFDMARFYAPSTIFFDEIDSIASTRGGSTEHEASRRVKSELLTQMDGVSNDSENKTVVVLAATNLPWDLDDAIRRRLEKRIYIPLPDEKGRSNLFQLASKGVRISNDVDYEELAEASEGYSGADITNVCHEASMMPIRRIIQQARKDVAAKGGGKREMHDKMKELEEMQSTSPPVCHQDFLDALGKVQSSVGGRDLSKYQQWLEEYGAV